MDSLATITQVTRMYGVSPRTLRYYEQIGLIQSHRPQDYAYRTYDAHNQARIGQILLLRKLRIPIRQIAELLKSEDAAYAIRVFEDHARQIGARIDAMETLREILCTLIERLGRVQGLKLQAHLSDDAVCELIRGIPGEPEKLKEERNMGDVDRASDTLGRLTDVRIVYLPPATVAASHFIGDEPENVAGDRLDAFARAVDITAVKPDMRVYGFNHPNPVDASNAHGYEFWMTIPEDMDVPEPLTKKRFEGGLYAAHMIRMGDFHEWMWLDTWVRENGEYVYRGDGSPENMFGSLEEHLNAYTHYLENQRMQADFMQLDLLIPVRRK